MSDASRGVTHHALTLCPHCGYTQSALGTTDGSEATPEPGDLAVCLACSGVLQVRADGTAGMPPFGLYEALRFTDPELYADLEEARERARQVVRLLGPPKGAAGGRA